MLHEVWFPLEFFSFQYQKSKCSCNVIQLNKNNKPNDTFNEKVMETELSNVKSELFFVL